LPSDRRPQTVQQAFRGAGEHPARTVDGEPDGALSIIYQGHPQRVQMVIPVRLNAEALQVLPNGGR
jgi:hypothetical protein